MEDNCLFVGECEDNNLLEALSLLRYKNVKFLGVGAGVCLRHLYFQALDQGCLDRFNLLELKKLDFSMGKHLEKVYELIKLMATEETSIILIYISCMDIVSGSDYDGLIKSLERENIRVFLLKRGPMAKRTQNIKERISTIKDQVLAAGGGFYE